MQIKYLKLPEECGAFVICINYLHVDGLTSKFADNTKIEGVADSKKCCQIWISCRNEQ